MENKSPADFKETLIKAHEIKKKKLKILKIERSKWYFFQKWGYRDINFGFKTKNEK